MLSSIQLEGDYCCLFLSSQFLSLLMLVKTHLKKIFQASHLLFIYLFSKLDKPSKSENDGELERTKDNAGRCKQ